MSPPDVSAWELGGRTRPAPPGGPRPALRRHVEQVMGMPISVALRGRHADSRAGGYAWRDVVEELRHVDEVFSTYRADSVISRLDRGELAEPDCPPEVSEVLALARAAEEQSLGAFAARRPGPDGRRRLDPSGVVKGWAVDRAAGLLADLDDTDFCLAAGGDLVCRTSDPDRPGWRIGIEDPHDPSTLIATVGVRTGAVATSGSAHRGRHLVDGRTGHPAEGVASVTVVGRCLTWVDIDATAAYAHGPAAARWLAARDHGGLVVWADGSTSVVEYGSAAAA